MRCLLQNWSSSGTCLAVSSGSLQQHETCLQSGTFPLGTCMCLLQSASERGTSGVKGPKLKLHSLLQVCRSRSPYGLLRGCHSLHKCGSTINWDAIGSVIKLADCKSFTVNGVGCGCSAVYYMRLMLVYLQVKSSPVKYADGVTSSPCTPKLPLAFF